MADDPVERQGKERSDGTVSEREKWEFEKAMRLRELELRDAELRRSRWGNPLVIAVFTAAAAGAANFAVSYLNAKKQSEIESSKAESALVLAAIRTDDGDVKKSQINLKFLADTGLLSQALADKITRSLKSGPAPTIASAPSGESTSGREVRIPSAGPQSYDFPVLNKAAVEASGWDIDVFSCAQTGPARQAAQTFAESLASAADSRSGLAGQRLGRIRLTAGKSWTTANVVTFDPSESAIADALVSQARTISGKAFARIPNTGSATDYYVSVFFCGA